MMCLKYILLLFKQVISTNTIYGTVSEYIPWFMFFLVILMEGEVINSLTNGSNKTNKMK